eukprot:10381614-Ditylum_brightwellii.AAC.1
MMMDMSRIEEEDNANVQNHKLVGEQMAEREAKHVGTSPKQEKLVRAKFLLKGQGNKAQPIKSELISILNITQTNNPSLICHTTDGSGAWSDFVELSIGKAFWETIATTPRCIPSKQKDYSAYAYRDKRKIANLKQKHTVYTHLTQKNIFMQQCKFKSKKTGSPGCLIEIHPTLIWKGTLKKDLKVTLEQVDISANQHAAKLLMKYYKNFDPMTGSTPVSFFTVNTVSIGTRIFRNEVQGIDRATGIFVPNGYHLSQGLERYKNLLCHQNTYLNNIGVVSAEVITDDALVQEVHIYGENMPYMQYLLKGNLGIESVESTNYTKERGRCFILYRK